MILLILNAASAIFALLAGCLWVKSSQAKVEYKEPDELGMSMQEYAEKYGSNTIIFTENGKDYCLKRSLRAQGNWSSWAAIAASVAAFLQCLIIALKHFIG